MTNRVRAAQSSIRANGGDAVASPLVECGERRYESALHRHLHGMDTKEIGFFVNPERLRLLESLIGKELRRRDTSILNVACGPFALEFYLQFREARIASFDIEPRLADLHRQLVADGLIAPTSFQVADVAAFETSEFFDAVIINDLFYSKHVDFYGLVDRYIGRVKPGGILYFDIQDRRAGPVWRVFGKDTEFRRYDLDEVSRTLQAKGMTVEANVPVLGIKGGLDRAVRQGMWYLAGLANNHVFVARKTGSA